jgi:hypothetical protein
MITLFGFILTALSALALFEPETPIGKKINRISLIKNDRLEIVIETYKRYLVTFYISLLVIFIYLVSSAIDFYLTNIFTFAISYLLVFGIFLALFAFLFFPKFISGIFKHSKNYLIGVLVFGLLLAVFIGLFSHYKNIGLTEKTYQSIISNNKSKYITEFRETTAENFFSQYANELKFIAQVNILSEFKKEYSFTYDLSQELDKSGKNYSQYVNSLKKFNENQIFTKEFEYLKPEILNRSNSTKKRALTVLPTEIQPYFVANYIIVNFYKKFSILAVSSKIYITKLYNKILINFGYFGLMLLAPIIVVLCYIITKGLSSYNAKYCKKEKNANEYFFTFIWVLSMMLVIFSLM